MEQQNQSAVYFERFLRAPLVIRLIAFFVAFILVENVLLALINASNFYPINNTSRYFNNDGVDTVVPFDLKCRLSLTNLSGKEDVTLVTYATVNEQSVEILEWNIRRWPGPVSIVFVVNHNDVPFNLVFEEVHQLSLAQECQSMPMGTRKALAMIAQLSDYVASSGRDNVDVLFYRTHQTAETFPVNVVRNIALSQASTQLVALIEPHQVISASAYDYLTSQPHLLQRMLDNKHVMILPSIIYHSFSANAVRVKSDARKIKENSPVLITEFVHLQDWLDKTTKEPYPIAFSALRHHEVAFVMRYGGPVFNEQHFGRKCSPATQVTELAKSGYQFFVLPQDFVVCLDPEKTHSNRPPSEKDCRRI